VTTIRTQAQYARNKNNRMNHIYFLLFVAKTIIKVTILGKKLFEKFNKKILTVP
jgi:hypothetical protein